MELTEEGLWLQAGGERIQMASFSERGEEETPVTNDEIWDVWYPGGGATGVSLARGRLAATDVLLLHAAPGKIDVDIRDPDGNPIARGRGLRRTAETPMARLTRSGDLIERLDLWPTGEVLGRPVLLLGGEVGILKAWWNAGDESAWRWTVEFSNNR